MSVLTFDRAFNRAHSTDFLLGSDRFAQPSQRSRRQETTQTVSTKRCSSRLQAVQEKARKGSEVATAAEQPATPQNIFRRAVQALRPSPSEQTEQEAKEESLEQLDTDTSPSSTGLWPSTLQYLLPRLPFGSSQPRSGTVPAPASVAARPAASDPAADLLTTGSAAAESGSPPLFEPVDASAAAAQSIPDSSSDQASLSPTVLPFIGSSPSSRDSVHPSPGSSTGGAQTSQQEAILADSSSRFLEDRDGQAGSDSGEAGSSGRETDGKEPPKMLFFWRNRQSKQTRPEPELRPLQASHPALQLVRERARTGSRPGQRRDGHKLGLVIEGGGMRGAVSGGGLQALHDLGLRDVFDVAYGSSAGAINATYFLSGQREGVDVYSQDISNKTFCDLRRLLDRKRDIDEDPVLNLNFLLNHVMEELKPLNWDAVMRSPIPLKVIASCLDTLQPVILTDFTSKADLKRCLQCSANVPNIAGSPIQHRGMTLVDAAVFEAVPFRTAIADGCSHVVVLATRPPFQGGRLKKAVADVLTGAVKRAVLNPAYMKQAWARELEMLAEDGLTSDEMLVLGLEKDSEKLPFFSGCHVYPIFPGEGASYAPVCTDVPVLRAGIQEGINCIRRVFQPYDASSPFPQYRPAKGLFPDEESEPLSDEPTPGPQIP